MMQTTRRRPAVRDIVVKSLATMHRNEKHCSGKRIDDAG